MAAATGAELPVAVVRLASVDCDHVDHCFLMLSRDLREFSTIHCVLTPTKHSGFVSRDVTNPYATR